VKLTTTASNSQVAMSNATYISSTGVNPSVNGVPVSDCPAALNFQLGNGTGTAASVVTAPPADCSGGSARCSCEHLTELTQETTSGVRAGEAGRHRR
jgi:hypothetical protein